mgnify:CR=1 FL=1
MPYLFQNYLLLTLYLVSVVLLVFLVFFRHRFIFGICFLASFMCFSVYSFLGKSSLLESMAEVSFVLLVFFVLLCVFKSVNKDGV